VLIHFEPEDGEAFSFPAELVGDALTWAAPELRFSWAARASVSRAPGEWIRYPYSPAIPPCPDAMKDPTSDFDALCAALESVLEGPGRRQILDRVTRGSRMDVSLRRLRASMSKHGFEGLPRDFERTVRRMDQRTRRDGFRVLHSWDPQKNRFTDDLVPVLMIDFFRRADPEDPDERTSVAILLDYYFLHLLSLAAMRAWDTDDPGAALDRVTVLLTSLQGPDGSGHQFVADAETLMIYALSQFHPEEHAYDRVIEKTMMLPQANEVAFARVSAAVLGAHLRWGFRLMYEQDVARMRADNVGDYPWLLYTVITLLRAWTKVKDDPDRAEERRGLAGSLLLGLSADPWAFTGRPPPALGPHSAMHAECRGLLESHSRQLLEELEKHRPSKESYAPLSLYFNFPHNALVAVVTLALLDSEPQTLVFNDLFEGGGDGDGSGKADVEDPPVEASPPAPTDAAREALARALTEFSGRPERVGYRGALLVAYDPQSAIWTYNMTMKTLREGLG
jgi:hypothetical protein